MICTKCKTEMVDIMFGSEMWWMCPICGIMEEYKGGT